MNATTMRTLLLSLLVLVGLSMTSAQAETSEETAKVGQEAPNFTLTDAEGKEVSLSDYKGKLVVLHWQAVQCPWERAYQAHLTDTAKKFAKPAQEGQPEVVFLGINSNKTESYADIAKLREKEEISYPVLKDEGNKVADVYGARTTPHIYIVNPDGVLVYKGGVEKAPQSPKAATKSDEQYLVPVLTALVNGSEPPQAETRSIGCGIKRVNKQGK